MLDDLPEVSRVVTTVEDLANDTIFVLVVRNFLARVGVGVAAFQLNGTDLGLKYVIKLNN